MSPYTWHVGFEKGFIIATQVDFELMRSSDLCLLGVHSEEDVEQRRAQRLG